MKRILFILISLYIGILAACAANIPHLLPWPQKVAWNGKKEERLLENSVGCYAGEFINLYPPGVPVLVPGEQITGEICENIRKWQEQGLCVQGIIQKGEELWVPVLKK